jgi:putative acyl-CoA dehydrogenase
VATHEVSNQPPPLVDYDLYRSDPVLSAAVEREGGAWGEQLLSGLGARLGSGEVIDWGFEANANPPRLRTHDRYGHRIDEVDFHPSWHALMDLSVSHNIHCLPFQRRPGEGARVVRDAMFTMANQIEAGHCCPISMTTSVLPALRVEPELAAAWEPRILSDRYHPELAPLGSKRGVLLGMGMTEKQGGSDVRANSSRAEPEGEGRYRLRGHKWFTSAPMCDAFLVLAYAPGGLTCFLLPRVLDDGDRNGLHLQRLKDKLGNRSNASSEVEFDGAVAHRVGEEGRGVPTIIEMVNHTRLDCVAGSVGLMRQAVSQASWHAAHRHAFGAALIDKPLMQNVLADLELEVEAATLLMTRLSGAFDRAELDPAERALRRLATPVAKYWVTKRCGEVVRESMECLGGNGYVEESILPRLYRESPVNAIWEGSGNVITLDVVRALAGGSGPIEAFVAELEQARGAYRALDRAIDRLRDDLAGIADPEASARRLVEAMALTWAGALMARFGDTEVADAYVASRLAAGHGSLFGTLDPGLPIASLAARALPVT